MPCWTKTPFRTEAGALRQIKALVWNNEVHHQPERSKGLNAYRCAKCGRWHVGHKLPEERQEHGNQTVFVRVSTR